MIKALSGLDLEITNLSNSDDTKYLEKALAQIRSAEPGTIDVGHAGTDMRFLTGFLAIQNNTVELTGSERMQQRPIGELVDVLNALGANIKYKNINGYPPLLIEGKKISGGKAAIKGDISSQFISSLLLVAPYFANGLELTLTGKIVSVPYIKMTIALMEEFGVKVEWNENTITVLPGGYFYDKKNYEVESDWSAASYYYSMVALSEIGTELSLNSLFKNSLQADSVCDTVYKNFGIQTEYHENGITIKKTQTENENDFECDFMDCPDIAQTVACTCVGLKKPFFFTGLQTLKVKETNRILALKNEFEKLGFEISVTGDSIKFENKSTGSLKNETIISTYNDHRMAMGFTPLCLVIGEMEIENAEVVSKSYPMFWEDLKAIGFIIK